MRSLIAFIVGDGRVGVTAGRSVIVGFWSPCMLAWAVTVACNPRARIALSCLVLGLTNLPSTALSWAGYAGKSTG